MEYEEIRRMDEEPFDSDVLRELCSPYYYGLSMLPDLFAILILHYYRKFDERYGTELTKRVRITQMLLGQDEEDDCSEPPLTEVMAEAMQIGGWKAEWISMEAEELVSVFEGNEKKDKIAEEFGDAYEKMISNYYEEGFVKSCFLHEMEMAMETAEVLDDGQVGILWNERLDLYMQYRTQNPDAVALACPKEDEQIILLSSMIWEPYMVTYYQDGVEWTDGEYAGRKYCRVALGNDGYNCCWYEYINPNWVCTAVKLGLMLDLAMEKIAAHITVMEGEAA